MSKPVPEKHLDEIVAAVKAHADGADFVDIAASLQPIPRVRNLQRWLATLVRQGRIIRVGKTRAVRFKVPADTANNDAPYFASPEGEGIWRLVRQPLASRAPADYRRIALDRYRPNETYYLPAEFRTQFGARRGDTTWRQKPKFDEVLTELVCTMLELEDAFDPAAGTPFGMFNPTMTLLTMNVSLITAGLPPVCLQAVLIEDLLAAFRGIWELNRTELLRDAIKFGA